MADDIHMGASLPPLTAAAQIRRVKPADPENEQRSPKEQPRRGKQGKRSRKPLADSAERKARMRKAVAAEDAGGQDTSAGVRKGQRANKADGDKTIDIRV